MRLLISLFVLYSASILLGQSNTDLWQKAVDIMKNNQKWVAGKMISQFELLDKDDKTDMINVSTTTFYADADGTLHSELVSMFTDGEDVTAEEKEKLEKENTDDNEDSNEFSFDGTEEPFHPDNQAAIKLTPLARDTVIDNRPCRGFNFTLPLKENTKVGTMWLDAKTGVPVLQSFTTDPLPPKMKSMKNMTHYAYPEAGKLYAKQVTFEGVASVLFIKKKVRGTMTFKDHWLLEKTETSAE